MIRQQLYNNKIRCPYDKEHFIGSFQINISLHLFKEVQLSNRIESHYLLFFTNTKHQINVEHYSNMYVCISTLVMKYQHRFWPILTRWTINTYINTKTIMKTSRIFSSLTFDLTNGQQPALLSK